MTDPISRLFTRHIQQEDPATIGYLIFDMVRKLKLDKDPLNALLKAERYLMDHEYDVSIVVTLLPKKSQFERGMEMFEK